MCPPPPPGIDCDAMLDNCNSMCSVFKTFAKRAVCRAGCLVIYVSCLMKHGG